MQNHPSSTTEFSRISSEAAAESPSSQSKFVKKLEQLIADHPLTAAAVAISIGVAAAWWIKRR
jgi:hypothetical protein